MDFSSPITEDSFPIELDSDWGQKLGFTSDKFSGYLWKDRSYIVISFIESINPGQGNLSALFDEIQKLGYGIKVPTPFVRMKAIIEKKGFTQTEEPFAPEAEIYDLCEVWIKEPVPSYAVKQEETRE